MARPHERKKGKRKGHEKGKDLQRGHGAYSSSALQTIAGIKEATMDRA
jgi:hypothetical protein